MINSLVCHPSSPCPAITGLSVEIEKDCCGNMHLRYRLSGDLTMMRIPPPQPPNPADNLWLQTCFEAFIGLKGYESYREFNFSPSGQYAGYAFSSYRVRCEWFISSAPKIAFSKISNSYELETMIAEADLPANKAPAQLRVGLSAIIELLDGSKSYWALHHPSSQPDFHHRDGWIVPFNRVS